MFQLSMPALVAVMDASTLTILVIEDSCLSLRSMSQFTKSTV